MSWRVQVAPPSKEIPSNSPARTGEGSVDIVTMFDGLVGLMAMASSASLPCFALVSMFWGTEGWTAPAGTLIDATQASATTSDGTVTFRRTLGTIEAPPFVRPG